MILYLDASALVKQYVREHGSDEVAAAVQQSEIVGTGLISRAEVVAALAKAVRLNVLTAEVGSNAAEAFRSDWPALVRVPITEIVIARADILAWDHGLREYDAVHLAAASVWAEAMNMNVTLATFDRGLWKAAQRVGLLAYPEDLSSMLKHSN